MTVQRIDYPNNGGGAPDGKAPRVETGAVQFGNDWKGLFIRGDNCMALAMALDRVIPAIELSPDPVLRFYAGDLKWIYELIRQEVLSPDEPAGGQHAVA